MKIIDTHTHIFQPDFDDDISNVIARAGEKGIVKIILPNIDVETIERVNVLATEYPEVCLPMMGLHPTSVTLDWKKDLEKIKQQFSQNSYIGVGEIGLDLYWDKSLIEEQKKAFEEQLRWSIEYNLPVSIHSRDAISEVINCINNVGASNLRGVFHSFGGNEGDLAEVLKLHNFYIGVNGVVTFKNSGLSAILKSTDLSRIVVETDAPYLAPVPNRGKRNEPSYTTYVIDKLAEIYEMPPEYVADKTTQNAKELFKITD
ncbi:TatD family deoxyribonuclease [Dysgonomonas sp. 216]|uniref:TatD family hydrolase n=1 Tax=Dysgonomonas sp. 216 TaxID=2302934 RepID=UPI0013D5BF7D|nr:TatD family hydrolase [Dysgonomonas sp. 216]NDW19338.1 TatD family deoxyribonuclease [Dysgonomonas sp. 216]